MHNETWASYYIQTFVFLSFVWKIMGFCFLFTRVRNFKTRKSSMAIENFFSSGCHYVLWNATPSRCPAKQWFGQHPYRGAWLRGSLMTPGSFSLVSPVSTGYLNIARLSFICGDTHRYVLMNPTWPVTSRKFCSTASLVRGSHMWRAGIFFTGQVDYKGWPSKPFTLPFLWDGNCASSGIDTGFSLAQGAQTPLKE